MENTFNGSKDSLECSRFEWIEPDESNGARLRSEATAQRAPFKLQKV